MQNCNMLSVNINLVVFMSCSGEGEYENSFCPLCRAGLVSSYKKFKMFLFVFAKISDNSKLQIFSGKPLISVFMSLPLS